MVIVDAEQVPNNSSQKQRAQEWEVNSCSQINWRRAGKHQPRSTAQYQGQRPDHTNRLRQQPANNRCYRHGQDAQYVPVPTFAQFFPTGEFADNRFF
jgi:hypothetical protein